MRANAALGSPVPIKEQCLLVVTAVAQTHTQGALGAKRNNATWYSNICVVYLVQTEHTNIGNIERQLVIKKNRGGNHYRVRRLAHTHTNAKVRKAKRPRHSQAFATKISRIIQ